MFKNCFVSVCLFFSCLANYAYTLNDSPSYITYIKNKGQWNNKVLYRADFRGGRLFLEQNAFTYLFYPQDGLSQLHPHQKNNGTSRTNNSDKGATVLNFHAVRMEFIASSPLPTTTPVNNKPFYHNYYLGKDASKWTGKVPLSEGVSYSGLYNNISLKAFSSNNDFRYDFTVDPGGDASAIKMKFTGQDKLSIQDGKLIISTSVGDIAQQAPFAYQLIEGREERVDCRYTLKNNVVGFEITGSYNHAIPLIIDPTLVFATFTGSTADNWGMTASYDNQGNGYTSGICFGTGYPLSTGAFQQTFGGGSNVLNGYPPPDDQGFDIVVSKFDPTGSNLLFSTYLGGNDNESPESIIVDNNGNLLVLGHSYSSDFPVSAGAYDITQNGGSDIIVTKFNPTGTALLGSTFVGGSADDGVNYSDVENVLGSLKYNYADNGRGDILLDNNNNVYIASCTESTNFPVSAGCVQANNKGGQDGCVFKLNPMLTSLTWSTYLGGSANDAAYNMAVDNNNTLFVTGGTESSDFPVSSGALHASYGGNIDGFLTHISAGGNAILQSTYIGTSGYDQSYFVQLDNANNVYIYGQTSGAYPITTGVYSTPNSGQFIHAFNYNLTTTLFSTEFGTGKGTPDIVPSAFLVDKCNNIYISGWGGVLYDYNNPTSSTNGMPVTANAFQPATDGGDFYFMVLKPYASALWYATFFGGDQGSQEHVDGGTSRFDKSGVIYQAICEGCGQYSDMPTTPSAWSTTNKSPNCNNALVKFSFDLVQTVASISFTPVTAMGCAPLQVSFTNQSQNATHFIWYFGDGDTSTVVNANHLYTTAGTYTVKVIAKDTLTCNIIDTTFATITINPPPVITVNSPTICIGSNATLTAHGASTYTWSNAATTASIVQSVSVTTQYTVTGTDANSCVNTATASITTHPPPIISVNSPTICAGVPTSLTATGASTYTWNTTATTASISVSPVQTSYYSLVGTDSNNCKGTATGTVTVHQLPTIKVPGQVICIGNTATLTASGASSYTWSTSDTGPSIIQSPPVTTHYTVTGTDSNTCVSTGTVSIKVNALPTLSVNSETICSGSSALLLANGALTYVWNTNNTGALLNPSPTITTAYTVTGTDVNNCVNTATANVTVNPSPTVSVSSATVCLGNTATLTASGANNYSWSTGDTTATISPSPTVTTFYTVSSSNGICVTSKVATVNVLVNHTQINSTGGTLFVCTGDSIKIKTVGTYTAYQWNTGQNTSSIEVAHAGTYVVHTIDNNGCKGMDSVKVFEDSPVAIPVKDTTICSGENAQLAVIQGNYLYLWEPGYSLNKDNIYNPLAHPTSNTTYTITVINGACINSNTLTVFVNPSPKISVKPKYSLVLAGESVTIHATSVDSCYWYPTTWLSCYADCNTSVATPENDITYTITAVNNQGCSTSATSTVQIQPESTFYIPNTFTPNGDEKNGIFKPAYFNIYNYKILIYDRWGLLLFQSNNPDEGWDGTYKGGVCQQDVYVYKVEYTDGVTLNAHSLAGHVNLIR